MFIKLLNSIQKKTQRKIMSSTCSVSNYVGVLICSSTGYKYTYNRANDVCVHVSPCVR